MDLKEYKVQKLKRLQGYLDNFQKDYDNVTKLSNDIDNINSLGSMIDYPFHKPLDKIEIRKWITKFKKNIENEITKELKE